MTKAKLVFESEDTFLSFPVFDLRSYPPERLKFIKPGVEVTPQDLTDLSEFARITNRIPRGVLAPQYEEEYVWDVYREVLDTARRSSGTMSASEKAEYDGAMAFLYVPGPDGLRRPSAALTAYNQHRDAHIKAQEEYKGAQSTAALNLRRCHRTIPPCRPAGATKTNRACAKSSSAWRRRG